MFGGGLSYAVAEADQQGGGSEEPSEAGRGKEARSHGKHGGESRGRGGMVRRSPLLQSRALCIDVYNEMHTFAILEAYS